MLKSEGVLEINSSKFFRYSVKSLKFRNIKLLVQVLLSTLGQSWGSTGFSYFPCEILSIHYAVRMRFLLSLHK